MLTVIAIETDKNTGDIYIRNGGDFGAFENEEAANAEVRRLYDAILEENGLEDNDAVDEEGNSIPGGCYSGQEANIYDCAEYANSGLVNVAYICAQEIVG